MTYHRDNRKKKKKQTKIRMQKKQKTLRHKDYEQTREFIEEARKADRLKSL